LKEVSDDHLVSRCRNQQDHAAFGELVTRYRDRVFRLAVSILGQDFVPDAEDVAQEVFVRVHHSLASYRGDAAFGTWLYRITFNHALNVKARMRYRAPHVTTDVLMAAAATTPSPDQYIDEGRRQQAVRACIDELPEVYQSALRLHYWLGASMGEIAIMLDAPENTVKSYLHRARRLLHAMLRQRGINA
jgi:RNA polymerase sigma-70 factor, ECF subfamily